MTMKTSHFIREVHCMAAPTRPFMMHALAASLAVALPCAAIAAPALSSGKITVAAVTAGTPVASPTIEFKYRAPATLIAWSFTFTAPHGATYALGGATVQASANYFGYHAPAGTAGTLTISNKAAPLSLYAEAGNWSLTAATLVDRAGDATSYTGTQLASLFPSLVMAVSNPGAQDTAPPVVTAGKLLNKTVSLSSKLPYLGAEVMLTDDLSGAYQGGLYLNTPGGQPYKGLFPTAFPGSSNGTAGPLPVTKGKFQFGPGFGTDAPTGTWTITGYYICDLANNCVVDMNQADVVKLFGTSSFSVTP